MRAIPVAIVEGSVISCINELIVASLIKDVDCAGGFFGLER